MPIFWDTCKCTLISTACTCANSDHINKILKKKYLILPSQFTTRSCKMYKNVILSIHEVLMANIIYSFWNKFHFQSFFTIMIIMIMFIVFQKTAEKTSISIVYSLWVGTRYLKQEKKHVSMKFSILYMYMYIFISQEQITILTMIHMMYQIIMMTNNYQ